MNPGFSSTEGVQIAMYRFSEVNYDETTSTVDVGPGLVWDDIYAALEPYSVNVVGGRVTGVGMAGFTLGGGECHHATFPPASAPGVCGLRSAGDRVALRLEDREADCRVCDAQATRGRRTSTG